MFIPSAINSRENSCSTNEQISEASAPSWRTKLWKGIRITCISAATSIGPPALILAVAAVMYFVFPPFSAPLIGYALGWFAVQVAMKVEMYYDLHCFVALRARVQWLEERCPYFHLIAFVVATAIAMPCGPAGAVIMLLPGVAAAAACDTRYFTMLQSASNAESPENSGLGRG